MRTALIFILGFFALALAGCLAPASVDAPALAASQQGDLPQLTAATGTARGSAPLVWEGARLVGKGFATSPGQVITPPCDAESCERFPFRVDLPDGHWDTNPGAIEVSIEWEHQEEDYPSITTDTIPMGHYLGMSNLFMHLRVLDADGNLVQDGINGFHFASLALLDGLPPGDYIAEVQALYGSGTYVGLVQVEPRVLPQPGDQLPDLVILPPSQLTLEHPLGREAPDPLVPLGRKGCDPDEAFEYGAIRCLRFATGFGNIGAGRLEMHLSPEESQNARLGEGRWAQRILDAEGNQRAVPAAPASYHKVHGHYHILGLDISTVYTYDLATQTRGAPIADGHKTGFCPSDSALVFPQGLGTNYPVVYEGCCYMWGFCQLDDATVPGGYVIGLTAGWYDVYPWWRADQYVDIGAAPDGIYELETCANPDGTMLEERSDNNCASAIFRLTGNDVEVLAGSHQHAPP